MNHALDAQQAAGDPPEPDEKVVAEADNFSLVLGGPAACQLLRRAHLSDDALEMVQQRIVTISMLAWLPLLLLSALEGRLLPGNVAVPFVYDIEVHIRFLVALPLLILAELVVHKRMRRIARDFLDRGLVPPGERQRFLAAKADALRLRNSVSAELVLLAIVYLGGVLVVWRHFVVLNAASWYLPCRWRAATTSASPASGTATSACRCSSSCCCAGISASSSGRASSGRSRACL